MRDVIFSFLLILLIIVVGRYLVSYIAFLLKKLDALRDDPIFYKKRDIVLDEKIEYIKYQFRRKRIFTTGIYKVPEEIIKDLKKDKYSSETLQKLADSIVKHSGAYNTVEVIIHDIDTDRSGQYTAYGEANWELHIFKDERFNLYQVIAIVIHECVHNFLYFYKLELFPEEENELLTDVTAVFLGFGPLLMKGYKPLKKIAKTNLKGNENDFKVKRLRVGYLNLNELAYVIRKYEEYVQEDSLWEYNLL